MCGAHGTWFDRGELRVASLAYANLPPPLEFHKEDYAPLQPPNPGVAVSLSIQGVEVAAFGPGRLDRSEDPAYFVRDTTYMKEIATSGIFEPMLAVAVAGAILCAALHVASLCGHTVVNGALHICVLLAVLVLMGFGVFAHYRMNNAKTDADGDLVVTNSQMRPWLTRMEYVAFLVVVFYALIAALVLWPWPENPIRSSGGDLTVAEARAVWPFDLAFYVGSAALVQSARRLARQQRQAP
jgi:hypothetical protein